MTVLSSDRCALVFVTDRRGLELTRHAIASAAVTQRSVRKSILFCVDFLPEDDKGLLDGAFARGMQVEMRPLAKMALPIADGRGDGAHNHVSATATLKIHAMASLVGEFDRLLYLDGDVLLMQDIGLPELEFAGKPIAAVYDIAKVGELPGSGGFHANCLANGVSPHYFNSGVIAMDCTAWNDSYFDRYLAFAKAHESFCPYQADCSCRDQCTWNAAFEKNWHRLPLTMNLQACAMFSYRWDVAAVRHYVGREKFIPPHRWRNDRQDILLLNQARSMLDLPLLKLRGNAAARDLNRWRHHSATKTVEQAIGRVELMYNTRF